MYQRILVCFDDSPSSAHALQAALQLAALKGSAVRIVHVIEHPSSLGGYAFGSGYGQHFLELAREQAGKVLAGAVEIARKAGVQAETCVLDAAGLRLGDAVAGEARSWGADLVVVGSHGRTGVNRALLGSGAEQVLRQAPVPVLVVRDVATLPGSTQG